ncbi:MAG: gamma-glutamyltransferase [Alphaproteobacteria bacterium]
MVAYDKASGAWKRSTGARRRQPLRRRTIFSALTGKPLPFLQAVASGKSTGAPSLYSMLKMAHDEKGKLPWVKLFDPAIKLAEDGFIVSPRMSDSIVMVNNANRLHRSRRARLSCSHPKGAAAGWVSAEQSGIRGDHARARQARAAALQQGPIAEAILKATHADPMPGVLTAGRFEEREARKARSHLRQLPANTRSAARRHPLPGA